MPSRIRFHDGLGDRPFVRELNVDLMGLDYTAGLHGSMSGNTVIEVQDSNESFLKSLKENSHFLKVYKDEFEPYGCVVESAVIDKGYCTLNFIGWYEYLEKIALMVAHKANAIGEKTTVSKDDPSWSANLYSDVPLGVFEAAIDELNRMMIARGLVPFTDASAMLSYIESTNAEIFARVYRVNALEFPTVKSVIDKILEDDEMDAITVSVAPGDNFKWILGVLEGYTTVTMNLDDDIRNITFEDSGDISRSHSLATGTDLEGNIVLSQIPFDSTVAYSSFIASNPADRTTAIDRINRSSMADADKRKNQVTFTVFDTSIRLQNVVELTMDDSTVTKIVITQVAVKDMDVTYTGQIVTDTTAIVKGITKPNSQIRKEIYNPLGYAAETSKQTAFKQPGGTGWRS